MWLSLHISLAITSCGYVLHSGIVIWTRVCVVAPPHESGFDVLWICFTLWYWVIWTRVWVVVLHMSLVFTSCGYALHCGMVIWTRVWVVVPPHESGFHVLWVCFTLWYGNMEAEFKWLSLHMSLVFTSCGYALHSGMVIWTRVKVVCPSI